MCTGAKPRTRLTSRLFSNELPRLGLNASSLQRGGKRFGNHRLSLHFGLRFALVVCLQFRRVNCRSRVGAVAPCRLPEAIHNGKIESTFLRLRGKTYLLEYALMFQVGVHPTRCLEFLPEAERSEMELLMVEASEARDAHGQCAASVSKQLSDAEERILARPNVIDARNAHVARLREVLQRGVAEGVVVAVGECGLDYDRLHFCPPLVQAFGPLSCVCVREA